MRSVIISFPGSNRERDADQALTSVTGRAPVHVWHRAAELPPCDLIVLPGGFSYGDYLRCGAVAARSPIMAAVAAAADRGTRVLGICNGFQILTEAGLLPGALVRNRSLKFVCKQTFLRVETNRIAFTQLYEPGEVIQIPCAHADGNYQADARTLARLNAEGRVVFRYVNPEGHAAGDASPSGAAENIAGICNARGTVMGLMPHPENATLPHHAGRAGRRLFESVLATLETA